MIIITKRRTSYASISCIAQLEIQMWPRVVMFLPFPLVKHYSSDLAGPGRPSHLNKPLGFKRSLKQTDPIYTICYNCVCHPHTHTHTADGRVNQPDEPRKYISQKTSTLYLSAETVCMKNTWEETVEWKNRLQQWAGRPAGRCRHAGRPLFPFMMLIAYRHPLTVSRQPYCKSETRQTSRGSTPPVNV